jgi:hypothetical protein
VLVLDLSAERAQPFDVDGNRATTDPVATRIGNDQLAGARQDWTEQHKGRAQALGRLERDEQPVQPGGVDPQLVLADPIGVGAEVAQHLQNELDVGDARRVGNRAGLAAHDGRGHELEDGILGAGDRHGPAQGRATLDDEGLLGRVERLVRGVQEKVLCRLIELPVAAASTEGAGSIAASGPTGQPGNAVSISVQRPLGENHSTVRTERPPNRGTVVCQKPSFRERPYR